MVLLNVFKLISIVCFVRGASACRANILPIRVAKNEITLLQNQLILSSKEVAVLLTVDAVIPDNSHDSVTINALTCWDVMWNQLVISNHNFYLKSKDSNANNTVYSFLSTQKLITTKVTSDAWKWICVLSMHWEGCKCNTVHNFPVQVNIGNQNETNDTREKIPLHEYQGPAEPKLQKFTCGHTEIKDMDRPRSALHEDSVANSSSQQANSAKNHVEPTEKTFSDTNRTELKKSRYRIAKNQMPTIEKMAGGVQHTNSFKDEKNNSSSHVGCGEATTSTTWLIFSVASVVIFLVGLVIGVFCRRKPEQTKQPGRTDEQTDEHIYDDVDAKGINNRPPLPAPEQAVYIYNSPYDHTLRYQHQKRLGRFNN